uniref:serine C-palmitoyltransferase n=1 Tax=Aceria tosichella TaxID=561515 RepID=A0A6G1SAS6_9ACAR
MARDENSAKKIMVPWLLAFMVNAGTLLIFFIGYLRDFLRYIGIENNQLMVEGPHRRSYPALYRSFEGFYIRNYYRRLRDGWNQPIKSVPGAEIDVMNRYSDDYNVTFKYTGTCTRAINMGSYNYLGMAENSGPRLEAVCDEIKRYGPGTTSSRSEFGTTATLLELEQKMAKYLGVEAALVVGMGFATNSNNIPALAGGKGTLIMSDELNHASLIVGCKISGATCKVFKHNNTIDLETKLRKELLKGQPTDDGSPFKPWRKVIIIVEGIYSMEGTIVNLPEVIRIKKKYKAYLYLDEAHSIGALDKGVVNYYRCDPKDVDVLMGTFTKSFGAAGGYIGGSKKLIDYLRVRSHATYYAATMAPPVARQIIGVIDSIIGNEDPSRNEGLQRIKKLRENTIYFRSKLKERGLMLIGNYDSPIVPMMVYSATIVVEIIRAALKKNVALVGAGFPATPLLEARVRFCVSSAHTREMLDRVIDVVDEIGEKMWLKTQYRAAY